MSVEKNLAAAPNQPGGASPAAAADDDFGPMTEIWKSVMMVLFSIGEQQNQKFAEVRNSMNDRKARLPYLLGWLKHALRVATERRRGDPDGIELSSGKIVYSNQVPERLRPFFALILRAQVTGSDEDICRCTDACATVPAFMKMLNETGDVLAEVFAPKNRLTMQQVWESFFSRTFSTAEESLTSSKILTTDDVAMRMPWLYLGLCSLTALDLVRRSAPHGPFTLALGDKQVDESNIPVPEGQEFWAAFQALRDAFYAENLNSDQVLQLRKRILWGDRDDAPEKLDDMPPAQAKIISLLQSIAIRASQKTEFKAHFDEMLGLLTSIYKS